MGAQHEVPRLVGRTISDRRVVVSQPDGCDLSEQPLHLLRRVVQVQQQLLRAPQRSQDVEVAAEIGVRHDDPAAPAVDPGLRERLDALPPRRVRREAELRSLERQPARIEPGGSGRRVDRRAEERRDHPRSEVGEPLRKRVAK